MLLCGKINSKLNNMEMIDGPFPKPYAPISQAVRSQGFVFVSGNVCLEVNTLEEQTEAVIDQLKQILESAGSSLEKVVKVNVYLTTMDHFPAMAAIYEKHFKHKPTRTTIAVQLYKNALVEMDLIAEA